MQPQYDPATITDWIYLESVEDLRRRVDQAQSASRYELIGIAGLIRKLILEERRLVDQVMEGRTAVPMFPVRGYQITALPDVAQGDSYWDVDFKVSGSELYDPTAARVERAEFIATAIAEHNHQPISIRDYVRYFAHVEGGVHRGVPKGDFETALSLYTSVAFTMSMPWLRALCWVGAATLDGLTELTAEVRATAVEPESFDEQADASGAIVVWRKRPIP